MGYTKKQNYYGNCEQNLELGIRKIHDEVVIGWYVYWGHSSDILSIRFKHTRILRIFGLF